MRTLSELVEDMNTGKSQLSIDIELYGNVAVSAMLARQRIVSRINTIATYLEVACKTNPVNKIHFLERPFTAKLVKPNVMSKSDYLDYKYKGKV